MLVDGIVSGALPVRRIDGRTIEADGLGRIPELRHEGGRLPDGIVLRLIPGGAHTVVQGQVRRDFPGVLNVLLDVPVAVQTVDVGGGLIEGVVDAQQRVGETVAGVIGVRRVVAEVVAAVESWRNDVWSLRLRCR